MQKILFGLYMEKDYKSDKRDDKVWQVGRLQSDYKVQQRELQRTT